MKTAFTTIALGAALLLTGSVGASAQEGLFTSERDCAVDVKSLCAGVAPGHGHILACLQSTPRVHLGAGLHHRSQVPVRGHSARRGRILACLQSHVSELSVGCSTILSKAIWVARNAQGTFINSAPPRHSATSPTA